MNTLKLGTVQTMTVLRKIDTGYVLEKNSEQALLHVNETDKEHEEGQEISVFLYMDKKGNITATTTLPTIQMDEYGWAEVVESIPRLGVFVDIGIAKDFLVSSDDLPLYSKVWPEPGDQLFVTLGVDKKGRLLAIPATEGMMYREFETAKEDMLNKQVSGRVYHTSKEGSAIITEDYYRGFIHHTERKSEPRLGELVNGRVIEVKGDGTLNVSLRPLKQHGMIDDAEMILQHLQDNNGMIPFGDKSEPEDIRGTFQISKAAFKRALGKLMKEGTVEQRDGKTYLK
ncbi:S1 RNA-binding domain-containing protein [Oceanobacillus sp. Castelsardo]|uniref:CvfB family protein n=1 Tax=Oceanobacillus sp. Castelsardo TaxID=1851204 RepID=UPI0008390A05|nr:S1-like domain-containing RNA-binding protein [Oceanobacillus sp. Castelsardo]